MTVRSAGERHTHEHLSQAPSLTDFGCHDAAARARGEAGPAIAAGALGLDEGYRMMGNVLGPDPESLAIGDRVRVVFETRGDLALPQFERSRGPAAAGAP